MPGRRVCGGWSRDMWKPGLRSRRGKILKGLVYHFEELTCPMEDGASQVALVVKNPPAKAGDLRDVGSMILGEGNGNLLQYSCLENPMDRGAWRAVVAKVAKSQKQLKRLSMHA